MIFNKKNKLQDLENRTYTLGHINQLIDIYLQREEKIDNGGDGTNGISNIFNDFDLKSLAYNSPNSKTLVKEFYGQSDGILNRLLDLDMAIKLHIPKPSLDELKTTILETLYSYESLNYPSKEEWETLLEEYPTIWLLFLIKSRLSFTT